MAEGLFGSDSRLSFLLDDESFLIESSFQGLDSLSVSSSSLIQGLVSLLLVAKRLFGSDSILPFLLDEESFLNEFSFQGLESLVSLLVRWIA